MMMMMMMVMMMMMMMNTFINIFRTYQCYFSALFTQKGSKGFIEYHLVCL